MAAAKYNFKLEQGATWRLQLTLKDSSDDPIDLTGHIVRMQLRTAHSARTALVSLTTVTPAHGISIPTPTNGVVTLELTDEETALLPPRELVYDVEVENPSGEVQRVLQGVATVDPEVTRE